MQPDPIQILKGILSRAKVLSLQDIFNAVSKLIPLTDETKDVIKQAWNLEEKHCLEYKLEDAIRWFKANRPASAASACVFKEARLDKLTLHHFFLDASQNPLLSGDSPHRIVHTRKMSDDLISHFGAKDMIVLK